MPARPSCSHPAPNQFRVLLASHRYVLMERLSDDVGLAGTELARAQVRILRYRVLKVGGERVQIVAQLIAAALQMPDAPAAKSPS